MNNYHFHVALFVFLANIAFAQPDTILVGYSSNDVGSSLINEMTVLSNDRIAFTQSTVSGYKAFVTDEKGQTIHQRNLASVDGYTISSSSFIFDDTTRYVYIGNATRDGKRFFIAYSLDTTLQEIKLIDTVQVENDVAVFTNMMKYNRYKSIWEGFGYGRTVSTSPITTYICYIGLDENYKFYKFERLKGDYLKSIVLEFQWIESLGRYFIKLFGDYSLIVDEGFNVVKEVVGITLVYEFNGTHITSLGMHNCLEAGGSKILCYAKENFNWPYNAAFATLDLQGDSIRLVEAVPLSDPPLGMNHGSQMRVDRDDNYVISGNNTFQPPVPNKIRVAKFSPTYDKIWDFTYESDITFAIWDMEIDQNNDIVLVGQAWNIFGDGQARGFLLKVFDNGTLSSYHEIPGDPNADFWATISSNPASNKVCLQTKTQAKRLRLWDMSGMLRFDQQITSNTTDAAFCLDLPTNLPPGFYAAEVLFPDGHLAVRKLLVGSK